MIKPEPFDAPRYPTSAESQKELLNDARASDDVGYIGHASGVIARARVVTEVAPGAGPTREALCKG